MAIIGPIQREQAPELENFFTVWDERMGYLPDALMTMARKPKMVQALAQLSEAVHNDCSLPPDITRAWSGKWPARYTAASTAWPIRPPIRIAMAFQTKKLPGCGSSKPATLFS